MKPSIEVIVSPAGDIQIDAVGFKGADCEKATRYLEEALGVVNNRVKKPEYHVRNISRTQQRLGI
jgi:DUF2997 family protein